MKITPQFVLGGVLGFILCFGLLFILSLFISDTTKGKITMFNEPGDCVSSEPFKVLWVDSDGNALARGKSDGGRDSYFGITVLFLAQEGMSFYDEQIIKVPDGKCVRQLGTYRYITDPLDDVKTVPAVVIR